MAWLASAPPEPAATGRTYGIWDRDGMAAPLTRRDRPLAAMDVPAPAATPRSQPVSVELQAMRGIAAMVVLAAHCLGVVAGLDGVIGWLALLANGSGAVAFFFVLSGFVLTLSWGDRTLDARSYLVFMVRRGFRILPMLVIAATLGTLYYNHMDAGTRYLFASDWFAALCGRRVDLPHYLGSLTGYSALPAPQLWSIFVELAASTLIPVLIALSGTRLRRGLLFLLLAAITWSGAPWFQYNWPAFLLNFYVGISIAWWGPALAARARRLEPRRLLAIVLGLLLVFAMARHLMDSTRHLDQLANAIEMVTTAPIIALAYYHPAPFAILRHRLAAWIGDLSYSAYLLHFVMMTALVQLAVLLWPQERLAAHPSLLVLGLLVATLTLTLLASAVSFRLVELPGIALGRAVIGWAARPKAVLGRVAA